MLARSTVLPEFSIIEHLNGLPDLPATEIALFIKRDGAEIVRFIGNFLSDAIHNLPKSLAMKKSADTFATA